MQNWLLNYTLFLLSPHFGMALFLSFLKSPTTIVVIFLLFLVLNIILVGMGYWLFTRGLASGLLKLGIKKSVTTIIVAIVIFIIVSLSYINFFSLFGLLPALITAIVSDLILRGLKFYHYEPYLSISDSMYRVKTQDYQSQLLEVSIWMLGTILAGILSSTLFFLILGGEGIPLFMAIIGGMTAFFVCLLILICRWLIMVFNLPMFSRS